MGFRYPGKVTLSMLITSADTPGPDVFSLVRQSGLGPVYTKRQRQCCDNSVMTPGILLSLKAMELLENGL